MKIELGVWQFVRVMVYLEAHRKVGATDGKPGLFEIWRDIWAPLDKELARLAQENFSTYANMMMDQSVVLEDVSQDAARATKKVLETIAADMSREIAIQTTGQAAGDSDSDAIENLQFEKSELLRSAAVIQSEL